MIESSYCQVARATRHTAGQVSKFIATIGFSRNLKFTEYRRRFKVWCAMEDPHYYRMEQNELHVGRH